MAPQGLWTVNFFTASASVVLLVLFLLLSRGFPQRFFRLWLTGWTLLAAGRVCLLLEHWEGGVGAAAPVLAASATVLLAAAAVVYTGRVFGDRIVPLANVLAAAVAAIVAVQLIWLPQATWAGWFGGILLGLLWVAAGLLLLRKRPTGLPRQTYGARLLGGALILAGLHGVDAAAWSSQSAHLLRLSIEGLLHAVIGVGMVVLVLEYSRTRAEDLNEKLRRLTLITTAAAQTFNVEEVLQRVLEHLVAALGATHGFLRLLEDEGPSATLALHAAVGYNPEWRERHARVIVDARRTRRLVEQQTPFLVASGPPREDDAELCAWMDSEHLLAQVVVRLPGKDRTLGVLGIGSERARAFQEDEVHFLMNAGNLLGLTVQNLALFQQVAEARREWLDTFDSISDSILVHDEQFRLIRVNMALASRLGAAPRELVGRTVRNVLREESPRWQQCPYCEGVAGTGVAPDAVFGGYLLVSTSEFRPGGPAASGTGRGAIHVLQDITERRRAEENYHRLFDNVQEGVFISTPEGRFVDFNEVFQRILGYESRDELLGADITSTHYVNPGDRERLKKLLRELGAVTDFEFQICRKDGEIRTLMESSFASRDANGEITSYQGFVLDVTERKRAEAELRRRNRELLALNSIWRTLSETVDLDEMLGRALREVVELFGADTGAIYLLDEETRRVRRAAAAGFRSEYARNFPNVELGAELVAQIRHTGATVLAAQSLPLPPAFRELQAIEGLEISYLAVLRTQDRLVGGLVVANRVAREFSAVELNLLNAVGNQIAATIEKAVLYEETRRAYHHLRRTQEQLLQSEKMAAMGQLISGVAHELNNPLTAILGYSQLLADSLEGRPKASEYLAKLHKQAQRTHRIVQNLLSFARQHRPERVPVRLNSVVEETLLLREYDLKLNNIRIHRQLDPSLPLTTGDSHQLQQVFLNILNNAVDAVMSHSGPREIWVCTSAADGSLIAEISDSGPGVSEPLRVFDPFYTTKPVGKGTGLGLSICYGIIKEHGGEITVRNAPPRGAAFTISLPVLAVGELRPAAASPPASADKLCECVLLVDDEEALLDVEREILKKHCAAILTARSGAEAVAVLEKHTPEIVVTDLKMPGEITGQKLYDWIAQHRPELATRVVFTMSDAKAEETSELLARTGQPFLQKPFEVSLFLTTLRRVAEKSPARAAPLSNAPPVAETHVPVLRRE